jgi:hypothetical protein
MTRYSRITIVVAILGLVSNVHAQDRLGTGAPPPDYRAGWTLTPTVGIAETYDDNISLFGRGTADGVNNDYVTSFFPSGDVHFEGKHTHFDVGYGAAFLGYRTFEGLDRWDQNGHIELRREESARLKWYAHANAATRPETDVIELGGIPYRRVGAFTGDGRGGVEYLFNARDSVSVTSGYQVISFQRAEPNSNFLRGGNIFENVAEWRHKLDERLALGADYSYRSATIVGDAERFNLHSVEGAIDYELSPVWMVSGAAGVVYMQPTPTLPSRSGPGYRIGIAHHRERTTFHVSYIRSYIPALGFGGVIDNQEVGAGFRTQLFHSPHFYTEHSLTYRDDRPLTSTDLQLPLRSLREHSIVGWEPDRWVRIELFYARVDQTSLRPGGVLYRNRVGFQIVTSKPMRMQ